MSSCGSPLTRRYLVEVAAARRLIVPGNSSAFQPRRLIWIAVQATRMAMVSSLPQTLVVFQLVVVPSDNCVQSTLLENCSPALGIQIWPVQRHLIEACILPTPQFPGSRTIGIWLNVI